MHARAAGHAEEILEQLFAFARHVAQDIAQQVSASPPQAEVGIWKPGMD
jgi:hypothetical protein